MPFGLERCGANRCPSLLRDVGRYQGEVSIATGQREGTWSLGSIGSGLGDRWASGGGVVVRNNSEKAGLTGSTFLRYLFEIRTEPAPIVTLDS